MKKSHVQIHSIITNYVSNTPLLGVELTTSEMIDALLESVAWSNLTVSECFAAQWNIVMRRPVSQFLIAKGFTEIDIYTYLEEFGSNQ